MLDRVRIDELGVRCVFQVGARVRHVRCVAPVPSPSVRTSASSHQGRAAIEGSADTPVSALTTPATAVLDPNPARDYEQ